MISGGEDIDLVYFLSCSPDGKTLAVERGKEVLLCEVQPSSPNRSWRHLPFYYAGYGKMWPMGRLAWSPDNRLLCAYDEGGRRVTWKLTEKDNNGRIFPSPEHYNSRLVHIEIDNNGQVIQRLDEGTDFLLSWRNGVMKRMPWVSVDMQFEDVSPDGKLLVFAGDSIIMRSVETGKTVREMKGAWQSADAVTWSPDKSLLAVGYSDYDGAAVSPGDILVFDGHSGELVHSMTACEQSMSYSSGVNALAFSPDGRFLAANTEGKDGHDGVSLWDTKTWRRFPLSAVTNPITKLAFSPDGGILAAADNHGDLILWKSPGKPSGFAAQPYIKIRGGYGGTGLREWMPLSLFSFTFTPDGNSLVVCCGNWPQLGCCTQWDTHTGKLQRELRWPQGFAMEIIYSKYGRAAWVLTDTGTVLECDAHTLKTRRILLDKADYGSHIAVSPNENYLAVTRKKNIALVSLRFAKPAKILHGTMTQYRALAFTPDSALLIAADSDGVTRVWSPYSGEAALTFLRFPSKRLAYRLQPTAAAIAADGHYVCDAASEKLLRWRDGERLLTCSELLEKYHLTLRDLLATRSVLEGD